MISVTQWEENLENLFDKKILTLTLEFLVFLFRNLTCFVIFLNSVPLLSLRTTPTLACALHSLWSLSLHV